MNESESLGKSTCGLAKDSFSVASPKPCASSDGAQGISSGKGASCAFGARVPLPHFKCTFCKKEGHTFDFYFCHVKHERKVQAKAFRKPRGLSHGPGIPPAGTKVQVASPSAKPSHVSEDGGPSWPLYHCSFCGNDGHLLSFCYRRAKCMRQTRASRPSGAHGLSHDMSSDDSSGKPCARASGDGKGACVRSSKPLGSK